MFRNFFKTAWRNLVKNRVYSALNILDLATGMAVALVIGLWVYFQFSYDRFLPNYEQVYVVLNKYNNNGNIDVGNATSLPLQEAIKKEIPGIQYVAQTDWMGSHSLSVGEKKLYSVGAMAGGDFLQIFKYPLIKGNAMAVLRDPYSIVLTESIAKALFGNDDPINKTVRFENEHDLKVTGVLKDVPANSTLQFKYIVPFEYCLQNYPWIKNNINNWRDKSFQTFVALQPNASYAQVTRQLKQLEQQHNPEDYKLWKTETLLQPLKDRHLYANFENGASAGGLIDYVKMFGFIGLMVLLIACINFMNLSTAHSEKRAREVGIRKAIGSQRRSLIWQFLIESIVVTFIAFLLSLVLAQLALPAMNALAKSDVTVPYGNGVFWLVMGSYVLLTGLLAGSRPAFYLSSFQPIEVLKGTIQTGRAAALPRKVLVVVQFTCSVALIISTLLVYRQIQHAKDRPTGYDVNRLMMSDAGGDITHNYNALKNELLQSGIVTSVTKSSCPVTEIWSNQRVDDWQGKLPNESLGLATVAVSDADYFKTLGMTITAGRNFSEKGANDSLSVLLNEAAVKQMRFKQPLNQIITWHDVPQRVRVIGVVKDAIMGSPFSPAQPTIFIYAPDWSNIIMYRLTPAVKTQQAIPRLTAIFNKYNPTYPYEYHFVDKSYADKFEMETLIGRLSAVFAVLAIFISCLGVFGLAAYMAEQRTKEIGIRKVLGAIISQVWLLLSKDFIVLVAISCVIASPLALYFLHQWLQKYYYHVSIGPWVFIMAAVMTIAITIITVSFQTIRAAMANPVKSLRAE